MPGRTDSGTAQSVRNNQTVDARPRLSEGGTINPISGRFEEIPEKEFRLIH
jgi:hypothetical protein